MQERLKELRRELNLTLQQFGDRVGVTKVTISRLENGINNVTDQMLKSICREFNVNEDWLLNGTGDMFNRLESVSLDAFAKAHNITELDMKLLRAYLSVDVSIRTQLVEQMIEYLTNDSTSNHNDVKELDDFIASLPDKADDIPTIDKNRELPKREIG